MMGLPPDEAGAYREMLALPSATPTELAPRVAQPLPEARRLLDALEHRGLVARSIEDATRYVASPPSVAIGALLAQRQKEIRLAEAEMSRLDEIYRAAVAQRGAVDVVEIVRGPVAIRAHVEQMHLGAHEEVMALLKSPSAVVGTSESSAEEAALARGVRYRTVLERRMLDDDPSLIGEIQRVTDAGEEIRLTADVPLKLIVVDRMLAILPVHGGAQIATAGALLVHRSSLLDALLAAFESVWAAAHQVVMNGPSLVEARADALPPLDVQILSLLLAGLTDDALAKQLGLSLRTVQRRVRALMVLAGVDTRIQLGWRAAHLGWLPSSGARPAALVSA